MSTRPPSGRVPESKVPLWFKLWFAFCALLGLGLIGVLVWALISMVNYLNRH